MGDWGDWGSVGREDMQDTSVFVEHSLPQGDGRLTRVPPLPSSENVVKRCQVLVDVSCHTRYFGREIKCKDTSITHRTIYELCQCEVTCLSGIHTRYFVKQGIKY